MKDNKKLLWFLAAVLFLLWGVILYQIISAIHQQDDNDSNSFEVNNLDLSGKIFLYDDNSRDPFRFYNPIKKDTIKKMQQKIVAPVWNAPPYRLTGIILNDKKRTALIESQDGSVLFLQERDTLSGIQILKIKERQVIYLFQKRTGEWNLQ